MPISIAPQRLSRLSLALVASLSLALAGCSSLNPFGSSEREGGTTQLPCPQVGVLGETDHITLLRGAGTDLTDVVARAEMGRVVSQCTYNTKDATITVDLAFDGIAELGPAATSRDLVFNVFVAVTRRFDTLDKKQVYQIPVTFEAGQRQARFVKTVDGTLLPYGGTADGRIYQVLVGFQLTAEQLEYNRRTAYTPIR